MTIGPSPGVHAAYASRFEPRGGASSTAQAPAKLPGDAAITALTEQAAQSLLARATAPGPAPAEAPAPARAAPQTATSPAMQKGEILQILGRHEGLVGQSKSADELKQMLKASTTPPDLKRAIQSLLADQALHKEDSLLTKLDSAHNGRSDGRFGAKDINALQSKPEAKADSVARAAALSTSYVPSDAKNAGAKARPITANDARRELLRYSDELPKKVTRESLQKIVDGSADIKKCPPQLVAAADFYVRHPDVWERDTGAGAEASVRRDHMLGRFSGSIELTANEQGALQAVHDHRDAFFGGSNLTHEKLEQLARDPKQPPQVRSAAAELQHSSVLFSMLDNAKHGYGGNAWYKADDQQIGKGDFDKFFKNRSHSVVPTSAPPSAPAVGQPRVDAASRAAMLDGLHNQPDVKEAKGGGLRDFVGGLLKVVTPIGTIASGVLSGVAGLHIPGVSWAAGAGALGATAATGVAKAGTAALEGKNAGDELKSTLVDVGHTALSLAAPGGPACAANEARQNIAKVVSEETAKGVTEQLGAALEKGEERG